MRIADVHEIDLVREALLAVEYWRMRRLAVDLVILNERATSYVQDLQQALETLVRANQSRPQIGEARGPGHVFLLRADLISEDVRATLASVARVVLVGERGRLEDQLKNAPEAPARAPRSWRRPVTSSELRIARAAPDLEYFNGLGGFAEAGREYVTVIRAGQSTPAPWVNVIANPDFGFQVSAEGGGYVWSVIEPRASADAVVERSGHRPAFAGDLCARRGHRRAMDPDRRSAARRGRDLRLPPRLRLQPLSVSGARHGAGTRRVRRAHRSGPDLAADAAQHVAAPPAPFGDRLRRMAPGSHSRQVAAPFVTTGRDEASGALTAANPWNPVFADRFAFLDMGGRQTAWTGDRREFLGRNGSLAAPRALIERAPLSGRVGAGLDPCAALQTTVELAPGESVEVPVFMGDAADAGAARALVERLRRADLDAVLAEVRRGWEEILGAVQVKTPDRSMDLMLNGWLLYQTVASRLWARAGFYQVSGAYGFRDQLQDAMALAPTKPAMLREQLLRAAARQFPEGDVQHWWLPNTGQGVRTRISDDRVWLAYALGDYLDVTGDLTVLDEAIPFIEAELLKPGEAESFGQPAISAETVPLYEHCARALDASLAVGAHGAPLIGGGDWNDGMNRVGIEGRGESVWLGWFLIATLPRFAVVADARGDARRATAWREHAERLRAALENEAWDGDWYRRGWFDDGAPLGSAASEECRIDSIAQSWAVLSGAADPQRARRAMAAVDRELILPAGGSRAALHAAVRSHDGRSRLHQGLSARRARERRPVHPCRAVVGDGVRGAGGWREGGRAVLDPQPDQPCPHARRRPPLSRGALCGGRRRLRRARADRTGRLDLVHRLGRLDAADRDREHPGP